MTASTTTTKSRKSSAKSAAKGGTKRGTKSAAKTTKSTGRKSAAKSSAPAPAARPTVAPVLTGSAASAYVTPEARLAAAKPGQLLVRRFDEHRELAQLATKRFQTTASRPGADPTKQSGVTTANIADCAAALKSRKTTADKYLGVPAADVIRYAETGQLTKRAEAAELTRKLREFSIATFGSGTRNKLRGKRIAAALSVLMDGGTKQPRASAAKSSAPKSATKRTTTTGRKSRKSSR
jgi:hypothetical protein